MKESIKSIALDHIARDRRLQMRVVCDSDYIEQLKDALIELQSIGGELDGQLPIVYQEGTNNWLADGYQRWQAHEKAGIKKMKCLVRAGTFRDAQRFALSANAKHGERRTNADKRRAVEAALLDEEWGKLSDRAIAQLCGLDSSLVMRMRKEIQPAESQPLVRIGIDGRPHDIKPKAKQSKQPQPASIPESDDPAKQVLGLQPDAKDAAIRDHLAKYPDDVESDIARALETTSGRVEQVKEQMRREAIAAQWEWQKLADQQAPADLEPVVEEAEFVVVEPASTGKPPLTDAEREAIHAARLESKTGVYDAKGRPVPEELLPVFALRSELIGLRQQLGKIATRLKEMKESEPGARYFDAQSTNRSIDDCQRNMRFGAPYIVCPQCGGYGLSARKECPVCRGAKFVPEKAWSALDDEQKRAAESFDAKRAAA